MHRLSFALLAAFTCVVLTLPTVPPGESSLQILNDPPRIAKEQSVVELSVPVLGDKPGKQVASDESSLPDLSGPPKGLNSQPAAADYKLPDLSGFTAKSR